MAEPAAEPGQAGLLSRAQAEVHYDEAVAEAVQACAEDTAGQRCYICFGESDEEGLVRMCACRGELGHALTTSGFDGQRTGAIRTQWQSLHFRSATRPAPRVQRRRKGS